MTAPRNAIVLLLDSTNRHFLTCYLDAGAQRERRRATGVGEWGDIEPVDTPNIDRLAARAVRFDRHWSGSLPCMPARHDILVGALDFLWRPWGSIELWEDAITYELRRAGVTTMLVSDHPHLFEVGGENYHTDFTAWDYVRGHESDPWRTRPDPTWTGTPTLPAQPREVRLGYDDSRTYFRSEDDFPGPRTMRAAEQWLRTSARHHDRFLLFVDEFDPHEPFDTPAPWAGRFDPGWDEPMLIWPPYSTHTLERGTLDERQARHIRANYASKLAMIDHWLGRVLDAVDDLGLWDDTAVILCTDHGHYLGERDAFGKPGLPIYGDLANTPFLVAWPGAEPRGIDALTTNVDIHATLTDLFGVTPQHRTHGRSLVPVLEGTATDVREYALLGYWGKQVHVVDKSRHYARGPVGENAPLTMWSNRWSTMPIHSMPELRLPRPDRRAELAYMPGSDVPVIRQPFAPGDFLPFWAYGTKPDEHLLHDLDTDPWQTRDLAGEPGEKEAIDLLRAALDDVEAPAEQYERLGLA
ncbi:MAG: sulfatase-like hydrolase/transferase [Actinomycetota bacterium]|nr:sulfatase-like hydrolase/transferase [Actinomycetota bacterium]